MTERPPVIIIGMHRSGTSMVARLLEQLGLFVGWQKEANNEAIRFQRLNCWLMDLCGADWDQPAPLNVLLAQSADRDLIVDNVRRVLRSPCALSFLGPRRYLAYRTPFALDMPWGWKDPRNTFTLPLWLDLFPQARVVHVRRHGVDVAVSLKRRESSRLARTLRRHRWAAWLPASIPTRALSRVSVRCTQLEGGLSLWEDYVKQAETHVRALGPRATEVRYEELLTRPVEELRRISAFCGLQSAEGQIESVAKLAIKGRAFAFRNDPELLTYAEKFAQRLENYGYGPV